MLSSARSDVPATEPQPASASPVERRAEDGSHCDATGKRNNSPGVVSSASCTSSGDTSSENCDAENSGDDDSTAGMLPPLLEEILLTKPTTNDESEFEFREMRELLSTMLAEIDKNDRVERQQTLNGEEKKGADSSAPGLFRDDNITKEPPDFSSIFFDFVPKDVRDVTMGFDEAKLDDKLEKDMSDIFFKAKQRSVKKKTPRVKSPKVTLPKHDAGTSDKSWFFGAIWSKKESSAKAPSENSKNSLGLRDARQHNLKKIAMDKRISWGKAKAYPGSLTVSELNDDGTGTSKTRSLRRIRKKKSGVEHQVPKRKTDGMSFLRSILGISSPVTAGSQKSPASKKPRKLKVSKGGKELGKENRSKTRDRDVALSKKNELDTLSEGREQENDALSGSPAPKSEATCPVESRISGTITSD
ncbi:unnamed protein product [Ixodes persulcatus]